MIRSVRILLLAALLVALSATLLSRYTDTDPLIPYVGLILSFVAIVVAIAIYLTTAAATKAQQIKKDYESRIRKLAGPYIRDLDLTRNDRAKDRGEANDFWRFKIFERSAWQNETDKVIRDVAKEIKDNTTFDPLYFCGDYSTVDLQRLFTILHDRTTISLPQNDEFQATIADLQNTRPD